MNTFPSLLIGLVALLSLLTHDAAMSFVEPHAAAEHVLIPVDAQPTHDAHADLVSVVEAPPRTCGPTQPAPIPIPGGADMTSVVVPAVLSFQDVVIRRISSPFVDPGLLSEERRAFLQVYLN